MVRSLKTRPGGPNREIRGVLLRLTNPLARPLSHSETKGRVFSPVGELAWYLAASNDADFVIYYINKYKKEKEDDGTAAVPQLGGL